jgi:DNA-binding SARP family transcriptional activator
MPAVPTPDTTAVAHSEHDVRITLQGAARLHVHGEVRALERKDAALLAYLVLQGPTQRAVLASLLWPQVDAAAARRNLRQRLFRMRPPYGFDLVTGQQIISLDPRVASDLAAVNLTQREAVMAELLAGHEFADCPEFADWLSAARHHLREQQLEAWRTQAAAHEAEGALAAAIALAQRITAADPLTEHGHRRLMRLHYLRGDRAAAIAAFEHCERLLKDELGAQPDAETRLLLATIESSDGGARSGVRAALPASVLRPPLLVGREAEMAAIGQGVASAGVVLVTGEAGAGKSRVLEAMAAQQPSVLVRSRAGNMGTPYALLAQLVRAVAAQLSTELAPALRAELARLLPELGLVLPMRDQTDQLRFMQAIEATLQLAAHEGLAVVVVDDLHGADTASCEALVSLTQADAKLQWLLAERPAEPGTQSPIVKAGFAGPVVALRPLAAPDVENLIASLQLHQFDAKQLATSLMRHCGGNPLFVLETVKQMLAGRLPTLEATSPSALPVPERVKTIIQQRLQRLSTPAVRLLRCAAVAEQDFDAALAAEVLGCHPLDLADAWGELEAQQVLNGNVFAHDLVAAAALLSLPAPLKRAIHGEIARCLARHDGDPSRVARHFAAADEPAAAAPHWLAAGQSAKASLRFAEAARFFQLATQAALAQGQHTLAFDAAKLMRSAAFEIDLSELSESALELLEQAAQTPGQRALALSERAVTLLHRGDLDGTERLAREGLRVLGDHEEPLVRIELHRNLAAVYNFRNETVAALTELRSVQHDVETLAPPELKFLFLQSLAIVCNSAELWDEAQRLYEDSITLALALGNVPGALQTCLNYATGLHERGKVRLALLQMARAQAWVAALPARHPSYSSLDLNYGIVLRMNGDYAGALRHIDAATVQGAIQTPGWLPLIRANEAQIWLQLGQPARAHQALQAAVPTDATPVVALAKWHNVFGDLEQAMGRRPPSLAPVIARLPTGGRQVTRWRMMIKTMAHDTDVQHAWKAGQTLLSEVRVASQTGLFIHLGARLAALAVHVDQTAAGVLLAGSVMAALQDHMPDDITRAHALWLCAQAFEAAGDTAAETARTQAQSWLRETASTKVPAEFRESFLQRHLPHRELMAACTRRLGAG